MAYLCADKFYIFAHFFLIFKSSLCIRKLFAENKSVKDCMLRLSSQRTAPRGLVLNFCVQTSANFCTLCSICFQRKNLLLICSRLRHSKTIVISSILRLYYIVKCWNSRFLGMFPRNLIWKESMNNWLLWIKWKEAQGAMGSEAHPSFLWYFSLWFYLEFVN